jgi:hypothetical protein
MTYVVQQTRNERLIQLLTRHYPNRRKVRTKLNKLLLFAAVLNSQTIS